MDIFNPNHYVPRTFLEENANPPFIIDEENLLFFRKNIFPDFDIKIINSYHPVEPQNTTFDNSMYLLTSNNQHVIHYINNGKLILENISLTKSKLLRHIHVSGNCELYVLTNNFSEQLSYISMNVFLEEGAHLKVYTLNMHNLQKVKYAFTYYLNAQAKLEVETLSSIAPNQYQDDSIQVIHASGSESQINYRSLTQGFTVSQVNSIIPKNASKASTSQHLKHTMLSDKAKIFSKPNLEISNSDVLASHGNSIGAFDSENIFYLEQRGLTKENAIQILLESEVEDFLIKTSIPEQLRKYMTLMEKKL